MSRLNNAIAYVSPTFSNVTGSIYYSVGGVSGDNVNTKTNDQEGILGVTLEYANGPLGVAGVYHNLKNIGNPVNSANETKAQEYALMASYDFKVVKLVGSFQASKFEDNVTLDETDRMWQIGAVIPVGRGNIHVAYGKAYDDKANAEGDNSSFGLAYTHSLSKRTTAYAGLNLVRNDQNSRLGNVLGSGFAADQNASAYGFGLRHTF